MKRLVAIVGASVLVLAACSKSSSGTASSPSSSQSSPTSTNYKIALVTGDNHDPFYVTLNQGAQAAAQKYGVTVAWQGPQVFEAQQQIPILDAVLASKPDFLLVAPTDVTALINPLKQFGAAGIPVITVDTDVSDKSVRIANFTSDNALGGKVAAQFLNQATSGSGKVLYLGPQPGVFTTDQRKTGFEAALKSTGLTYLGPQFTNDDPNQAATDVAAVLQRNPDLAGIFASDTLNGAGAATAVQAAGKSGSVKIVAFDAEPEEVAALKRGTIQALIVQKAYDIGYMAVENAVKYLNGDHNIPPQTYTSYVIATQANINDPNVAKYIYHVK